MADDASLSRPIRAKPAQAGVRSRASTDDAALSRVYESIADVARRAVTEYNDVVSNARQLQATAIELLGQIADQDRLPSGKTPEEVLEEIIAFLTSRIEAPTPEVAQRSVDEFPKWDKATTGQSAMAHFLEHYGPIPLAERPSSVSVKAHDKPLYQALALIASRNKAKKRAMSSLGEFFPTERGTTDPNVALRILEDRRTRGRARYHARQQRAPQR